MLYALLRFSNMSAAVQYKKCGHVTRCNPNLADARLELAIDMEVRMAKYGRKAQQKVKRAMHERKRGKLKSGRSGKTVKSRKQAIAIGLSEARREGGKVPAKRSARKKSSSRKTTRRSGAKRSSRSTKRSSAKKK